MKRKYKVPHALDLSTYYAHVNWNDNHMGDDFKKIYLDTKK